MGCPENELLIHGYLDGELDLVRSLDLEAHLRECSRCAQAYRNHQVLRHAFEAGGLYFRPSESLAARIRASLRSAAQELNPGGQEAASADSRDSGARVLPVDAPRARPLPVSKWVWAMGLAACVALVIFVAARFAPRPPAASAEELLAQDVVASHIRSLMASHLTDVPSSDQHTVKPWFDGKLDFSPPVTDLSSQGFPLVGGRLDYLAGRPVAALVYQRRKHLINLFVWPAPLQSSEKSLTRQGYNVLHWSRSGMDFWAVSDVNAAELHQFVELVQDRP